MGEVSQKAEKKFLKTNERSADGEGFVLTASVRDADDLLAAMAEGKIRL